MVRTLLRNSKKVHFSKLITDKVHPSTIWRVLKTTLSTPKPNWSCFDDNASSLSSRFNHHFISTTSPLYTPKSTLSPILDQPSPLPTLKLDLIEPDECKSRLLKLNPHKSTGHDGIPSAMLKTAHTVIASPLCSIINSSITSRVFPSSWKKAIVKPLHKGGPRDNLSNYRRISLLPITSKILEGVVRDQVFSHLQTHNLLSPWQSGFQPGHSTTTTLLHITNEWYSALDKGLIVGAVFLDLSKAFDTVNHSLLLSRLSVFGVDPAAYQWFSSYLSSRSQCVNIDSINSEYLPVVSGVPQGSVLGPLLFSIFVNNMPECIQGVNTVLFADDTTIFLAGHSAADISASLTHALKLAHSWLLDSGLRLNVAKTKCMLIHSNRRKSLSSLSIHLDDTPIEQVRCYKFLGVKVNDTLSWEDHIQYISTKVSRGITLLRHLARFLPRRALCYYYNAYILPQFSYADSVWNTCTRAQSIKLERLQNFAARVILSRRRDSSATEMRQELGWPTLTSRRTLSTAVMTYKSISGLNPPYLSVLFKPLSNHHVTRSSSTRGTCIPVIRNEYGRKSFAFQGAKMWNDLPAGLRSAASLDEFTKAARCLIFSSTA